MQYLIEPVYTFPEWIPAVLVEWEEIANAFWKCWQTPATLMELRSPEFMRLRFFGLMIQLASAACGITLALLYGRLRTREEREVESLRGMYKMGTVVSTLRTGRPGPLMDMDYVPLDQDGRSGQSENGEQGRRNPGTYTQCPASIGGLAQYHRLRQLCAGGDGRPNSPEQWKIFDLLPA